MASPELMRLIAGATDTAAYILARGDLIETPDDLRYLGKTAISRVRSVRRGGLHEDITIARRQLELPSDEWDILRDLSTMELEANLKPTLPHDRQIDHFARIGPIELCTDDHGVIEVVLARLEPHYLYVRRVWGDDPSLYEVPYASPAILYREERDYLTNRHNSRFRDLWLEASVTDAATKERLRGVLS